MAKGNPHPRTDQLIPWKPGVSANPGGVPAGKRISTWMMELGQMPAHQWPEERTLPVNGRIALARLKTAMQLENADKSTEIVLERTEGAVDRTLHIKAEGVVSGMPDEERRKLAQNYLDNQKGK